MKSSAVAVVGGGAWGTALASILAKRYDEVRLWVFEADLAASMAETRENSIYLPGIRLPGNIRPSADLRAVVAGMSPVVLVVPSHVFRLVLTQARPALASEALLISATKGIEVEGLATMSAIMHEVVPEAAGRQAVLSGPSFAREVAAGRPTAIVAAATDPAVAQVAQAAVSGGPLRVYAGTDPLGVELGGALKNVMAIAAGVVDGLELGTNARAALISRGLAEMARLGVRMGGRAATFAGLTGMGDLVLTCTGDLSRNRQLGLALGRGERYRPEASPSVAEGVNACRCAVRLAERYAVEMPICRAVHRVLFEGHPAAAAVEQLMARELRFEEDSPPPLA